MKVTIYEGSIEEIKSLRLGEMEVKAVSNKVICIPCGQSVHKKHLPQHRRTAKHKKNVEKYDIKISVNE